MKKRFFLISVFLILIVCSYVRLNNSEQQSQSCIAQNKVLFENSSNQDRNAAIKEITFEFVISTIFTFISVLHIFLRKVTFRHIDIGKKIKYRKQMPRGNLAFDID